MTMKHSGGSDDLLALLEQAEAAEPDSDVKLKSIVSTGDTGEGGEIHSLPLKVSVLTQKGWVYVYDVRTGEPSLVNRNMLPRQLTKTDENGKRIFTTIDPGIRPDAGNFKCWLHKEHEKRPIAFAMGLPTCKKSNIPAEFNASEHVRLFHPREYAAIRDHEQRAQVEADRDRQERLIEAAVNGRAPQRVVGSESPGKIVIGDVENTSSPINTTTTFDVSGGVAVSKEPEVFSEVCDCGETLQAKSPGGLGSKRRHHRKTCPNWMETVSG